VARPGRCDEIAVMAVGGVVAVVVGHRQIAELAADTTAKLWSFTCICFSTSAPAG